MLPPNYVWAMIVHPHYALQLNRNVSFLGVTLTPAKPTQTLQLWIMSDPLNSFFSFSTFNCTSPAKPQREKKKTSTLLTLLHYSYAQQKTVFDTVIRQRHFITQPLYIGAQALPLNALWTPAKSQLPHLIHNKALNSRAHTRSSTSNTCKTHRSTRRNIEKWWHASNRHIQYVHSFIMTHFIRTTKKGVMTRQEWHKAK